MIHTKITLVTVYRNRNNSYIRSKLVRNILVVQHTILLELRVCDCGCSIRVFQSFAVFNKSVSLDNGFY